MTNAEQLNAIKERAENTSFDKAYVKGDPWKGYEVKNEGNGIVIAEVPNGTDAEFIAHAREDVPALVAEVERLNTVKHRLNSEVELYRKQYEGTQIQLSESEAEIERLRKALEFYADEQSYEYEVLSIEDDGTENCEEPLVVRENGKLAREALE